ncbi:hypothetical protein GGD46_005065 [Rhizobium lusitanum]|uniref:Uncharacterized protein n=1 Tax=Rhizobium lusitanum TaxID=293958 RepID=A0A7X0IV32_9HYPH|nr:hypothetical protein [Rhizobium lusitanum]
MTKPTVAELFVPQDAGRYLQPGGDASVKGTTPRGGGGAHQANAAPRAQRDFFNAIGQERTQSFAQIGLLLSPQTSGNAEKSH